jgi:hypothetical protein
VTRVPAELASDWQDLLTPTPDPQPFDPDALDGVPEAGRRWLTHAIAPGTPLRRRVRMRQHGRIRLRGRWWPIRSIQALDPLVGYVWPVTTRLGVVPLVGVDRLSSGSAEMRHALLGRFPVVDQRGPDLMRSAAGRATSEICWAPAAALDPAVRWEDAGPDEATLIIPLAGEDHALTIRVDEQGRLVQSAMPRWASVDDGPWRFTTFGARVLSEGTFGGFTVPTHVVAGYGDDDAFWNEGAFIDLRVDDVIHL